MLDKHLASADLRLKWPAERAVLPASFSAADMRAATKEGVATMLPELQFGTCR
jgi:hypothetical protein